MFAPIPIYLFFLFEIGNIKLMQNLFTVHFYDSNSCILLGVSEQCCGQICSFKFSFQVLIIKSSKMARDWIQLYYYIDNDIYNYKGNNCLITMSAADWSPIVIDDWRCANALSRPTTVMRDVNCVNAG